MKQMITVNEPAITITVNHYHCKLSLSKLRLNGVFTIQDGYEKRTFSEVNFMFLQGEHPIDSIQQHLQCYLGDTAVCAERSSAKHQAA